MGARKATEKSLYQDAKRAEVAGRKSIAASRYSLFAEVLRKAGNLHGARKALERALALAPKAPRLQIQLALLLMAERKTDLAETAIRTFISLVAERPERKPVYEEYLEKQLVAFPRLRSVYRKGSAAPTSAVVSSLPILGDDSDRESSLGAMIRDLEDKLEGGETAALRKAPPSFEPFVEALEKKVGTDTRGRIDLAVAFLVLEQFALAARFVAAIDEGDPLGAIANCVRGEAFLQGQQWIEALDAYQAALRCLRCSLEARAEATYGLAEAYFRLGDVESASQRLSELEKTFPSYRDSVRLRERVASRRGRK